MLTLNTKIEEINKVGAVTAKRLKKIGLNTVVDLLYYFPFRYEDYSKNTKIKDLIPGEKTNIIGQIELIQNKRSPRKRINITEALICDDSDTIKVVWFNQPYIAKTLHVGDTVSLAGTAKEDYGSFIMQSPAYEKIFTKVYEHTQGDELNTKSIHTQGIVPNYHLTANITQKQIRFIIKQIMALSTILDDWLPDEIINKQNLLPLWKAINTIHFPKNDKEIEDAKKRLSFNELFLIQLQSQLIIKETDKLNAPIIKFKEKETKKFVESLPFCLTDAQKKVSWKIIQDIEKEKPMSRLLEGDVGSGKTIVAVMAMLNTALNGYQSVLMVPTEILAEQHFNSITNLLKNFNIPISLFTRTNNKSSLKGNVMSEKSKIPVLSGAEGLNLKSKIIIGTHALIQEKIEFNNLGLVIIDEQHRFGVEQRKMLIDKSNQSFDSAESKSKIENRKLLSPHLLSMTATPIPRSLALAIYGDLDISIIDEMPKNRKKIITKLIPETNREETYNFIREQVKNGRQVFVICPLIDISDKLGVKAVNEEYKKLNENIFPDLNIGLLHGKLKPKEKEKIMQEFLNNTIKILVSTSVVEVGVDIPNASIMIIEGADRFGLAQLHQFRGRVGRDVHQSYCFLFTENTSPNTIKRLNALIKYDNGFDLAKIDLKLRGPGEVYGKEQKGFPELKIATLFDYELMKNAKNEAEKIIKDSPDLKKYPMLKEKISNVNKQVHLD